MQFFVGLMNSGAASEQDIAIRVLDGAQTTDQVTTQNRIDAANRFIASIDTPAEVAAYSGPAAIAFAQKLLSQVTANPASIPNLETINSFMSALASETDPYSPITPTPIHSHYRRGLAAINYGATDGPLDTAVTGWAAASLLLVCGPSKPDVPSSNGQHPGRVGVAYTADQEVALARVTSIDPLSDCPTDVIEKTVDCLVSTQKTDGMAFVCCGNSVKKHRCTTDAPEFGVPALVSLPQRDTKATVDVLHAEQSRLCLDTGNTLVLMGSFGPTIARP